MSNISNRKFEPGYANIIQKKGKRKRKKGKQTKQKKLKNKDTQRLGGH